MGLLGGRDLPFVPNRDGNLTLETCKGPSKRTDVNQMVPTRKSPRNQPAKPDCLEACGQGGGKCLGNLGSVPSSASSPRPPGVLQDVPQRANPGSEGGGGGWVSSASCTPGCHGLRRDATGAWGRNFQVAGPRPLLILLPPLSILGLLYTPREAGEESRAYSEGTMSRGQRQYPKCA